MTYTRGRGSRANEPSLPFDPFVQTPAPLGESPAGGSSRPEVLCNASRRYECAKVFVATCTAMLVTKCTGESIDRGENRARERERKMDRAATTTMRTPFHPSAFKWRPRHVNSCLSVTIAPSNLWRPTEAAAYCIFHPFQFSFSYRLQWYLNKMISEDCNVYTRKSIYIYLIALHSLVHTRAVFNSPLANRTIRSLRRNETFSFCFITRCRRPSWKLINRAARPRVSSEIAIDRIRDGRYVCV